jgi:U3 small nucleolar RNA-associated protein 11
MSEGGMNKAVKRRIHKERAQPYERKKFGLLEKKKDYKLRAKDYHRKEDTIKKLKEKASFRNPDEFYYKMNSTKTQDGIHVIERNNQKDDETLKQWNTQDLSFLNMKHTQTLNQIEKLRATLHNLTGAPAADKKRGIAAEDVDEDDETMEAGIGGKCNKRVVFVDSDAGGLASLARDEVKRRTAPSLPEAKTPEEIKARAKIEKESSKKYKELQSLLDVQNKLNRLRRRLQQQRNLSGKGTRVKEATLDKFGEEIKAKTVYKWKLDRKK